MKDLKNHAAIITGAGSGIGQALAIEASRRGAHVFASDVNSDRLKETADLVSGDMSCNILDVSKINEIENYAKEIIPALNGRPVLLFNNAGIALASGSFNDTELDEFENLININLWGVVRMTKMFLPYMLEHNSGCIINISSILGIVGMMHQSAYCTSKFGVRGFTEVLRMELFDTNVKTLAVHPGGVHTNIANDSVLGKNNNPTKKAESAANFNKSEAVTPNQAASIILEALQKGKERVLVGKDARKLDRLARLMPVGYTKGVRKWMVKTFGEQS